MGLSLQGIIYLCVLLESGRRAVLPGWFDGFCQRVKLKDWIDSLDRRDGMVGKIAVQD